MDPPPVVMPDAAALSARQRRELYDLWRTVLQLHGIGGAGAAPVYPYTIWELLQHLQMERQSRT